ncbi:hypothetical protein [Arthrobacter sp. UYEF36]|uniref:hypothetical protein n=1 Tax=Arthrobacter sp. UYEF36 TaxID=1756366 RepID=UPI0033946B31
MVHRSAGWTKVTRSTAGWMLASIPAALRNRARAAYRATSYAEGDNTWSHFVAKAIEAETAHREAEHNGVPLCSLSSCRACSRSLWYRQGGRPAPALKESRAGAGFLGNSGRGYGARGLV